MWSVKSSCAVDIYINGWLKYTSNDNSEEPMFSVKSYAEWILILDTYILQNYNGVNNKSKSKYGRSDHPYMYKILHCHDAYRHEVGGKQM
jgi:hypothetical protein